LLITAKGTINKCTPENGGKSAPSVLSLGFSIPLGTLADDEIAKLARYLKGPTVTVTVDLGPFVAAVTGKSGAGVFDWAEKVAAPTPTRARRGPERVTPLPEERCQRCGSRIGEDPERRMYAPISGPSQPMHGACADQADRLRELAATPSPAPPAPPAPPEQAEVLEDDEPAPGTMQPTAAAAVELLAPGPVPVPTELPGGVVAIGAEGEAIGADWPSTTDPRPGRVADPEAAAALGDLAPHLERVASEVDQDFETLVGPSAGTRKRRAKVPAGG
jgi:hypothetical protein